MMLGGIADECCRAPHVGGEDLGEEVRVGADLQRVGDQQGNRHDQQHGSDVVQQRRERCRHQHQGHQYPPGIGVHPLHRPDGEVLEDAGPAGDGDDDHHPGEQPEGVEVDTLDGRLLGEDAAEHHETRPSMAMMARFSRSLMISR